ncbi:MAG: HdeD family acid-resistance protein [Candidatus Rokuibacteriota bacterium]
MVTPMLAKQQQSGAWWLFLLQGIAAILLGLMLLTNPGATLVALTTFLGFYLLITGMLALVRVFVDRSTSWLWSLLSGIVGILAGVFVLNHPLLAAVTVPALLILIIGFEALSMGVFEIIRGFKGGGAGAFILGVINALIGLLLLVRPMGAALAVPFVLAMLLLIEGIGLLIWAFRVRA